MSDGFFRHLGFTYTDGTGDNEADVEFVTGTGAELTAVGPNRVERLVEG